MNYNFDEIIDRQNTDAIKVDYCKTLFGSDQVIPLWVADMDFRTPDFILDAIRNRLEHPVLGYTRVSDDFFPLTCKWIFDHHGWNVKQSEVGFLPGIVPGLSYAVQCFTNKGGEIIVQSPVYHPFFSSVLKNNRVIINNQLAEKDGKLTMCFEDLKSKFTDQTQLLILCNPHNPGGRVWTRNELEQLAAICEQHSVIVISDEVHADMVLPGKAVHTPFASISEWTKQHTVTFMAPSKVFNMPGLITSCFIAQNSDLFHKFNAYLEVSEQNRGNLFAYIGAMAAYRYGEEWRKQMLDYISQNIEFVDNYLKNNIPQIKLMHPEASFLVWLDCSEMGLSDENLEMFFSKKAKLGMNKGVMFGKGGEQHMRMNVATPKANIEKAMYQLSEAFKTL